MFMHLPSFLDVLDVLLSGEEKSLRISIAEHHPGEQNDMHLVVEFREAKTGSNH